MKWKKKVSGSLGEEKKGKIIDAKHTGKDV